MLKKFICSVMAASLVFFSGQVWAGETDLLIKKLVEKGILTSEDAVELQKEIKAEVKQQNAKGTNDAIPSWVQTTKVKGDLRLRYQSEQREGSTTRNRGRVRYRVGIESSPNEQVTVAAGLAGAEKGTSTDNARSTNTTLQNAGDRGDVRLDYAYAKYKPASWLSLTGGKYNALNTGNLWYTTDMMWDADVNQEGVSARMDLADVLGGELFTNAGYWVMDEAASSATDIGMYYGQAGMVFKPEPVTLKIAGGMYGLNGTTETGLLDGRASGNTVSGGSYVYDFGAIYVASAEAVYDFAADTNCPIKMIGLFGDYVVNPDPDSQNTGWASGFKFGHSKVAAKTGDWQFKYQYASLGADAWLDSFPDADRYSGNTNVRGHEVSLDVGLLKNVSLGLDYYRSEVKKGPHLPESVFQTDVNLKF